MQLIGKFVVNEIYKSPKNTNSYYTMSDLDNGAQIKLTVDGEMKEVKPGNMIHLDAQVRTRTFEKNQSIIFEQGTIKKI